MAGKQVAAFAERLALLHREAGRPTATAMARQLSRLPGPPLSPQKFSKWRTGARLPGTFDDVEPLLLLLIAAARQRAPNPALDGLYDRAVWQRVWEAASQPESPTTNGDSRPAAETSCPYRGLQPFGPDDARYFFGREAAVEALLARAQQACRDGGLLVIGAASGAGKSSLLGAGLLPAIRAGRLSGAREWPIITLTPGAEPLRALTERIPELADTEPAAAPETLCRHTTDAGGQGARTVIVVDQFEEVFTLARPGDRETFIDLLAACAAARDGEPPPAVVILAVRADFYPNCLDHPQLVEALRDHVPLGPMTASEIIDVIRKPANEVGRSVEPALVELLLADAGVRRRGQGGTDAPHAIGILPLLSHTLRATWAQRDQRGRLTVAAYRATGGLHGAISQSAERALATLDVTAAHLAVSLLIRLTRVAEDGHDTRRRVATEQLLSGADPDAARRALDALVKARLVTVDDETAQITHEALLRAWPRLRTRISKHRAALVGLQQLEDDAREWATRDRDDARLYRGAQLDEAQGWVTTPELDSPSATAVEFLDRARTSQEQAEQAEQRRRRRDRVLVTVLAVTSVVLVVLLGIAWYLKNTADGREHDANVALLIAEADRLSATQPSDAIGLYLAAYRGKPSPELRMKILSLQAIPQGAPLRIDSTPRRINGVAYSLDGRLLATAGSDRTVRLWSTARLDQQQGEPLAHESGVRTVAFDPTGRVLATGTSDGVLRLWDVADPDHAVLLGGELKQPAAINSVVFSPDGRQLVAALRLGTVALFDTTDPARPNLVATPLAPTEEEHRDVNGAAFSPDGRTIAASSDDTTVRLWDVSNPRRVVPRGRPLVHDAGVNAIDFSHDGRTLATTTTNRTVWLWDLRDADRPAVAGSISAHSSRVLGVSFSPDDTTLASSGDDRVVHLWDVRDPRQSRALSSTLAGHSSIVYKVAFSPDGSFLASAGEDGARVWQLPPAQSVLSPQAGLAFSPDGRLLAGVGQDNQLRLWGVAEQRLSRLGGDTPVLGIQSATFSPDGRLLAGVGLDHQLRLWRLADQRLNPLGNGLPVPGVQSVVFSPDGRLLAGIGGDEPVQLYELSPDGGLRKVGEFECGPASDPGVVVAFSPRGNLLACSDLYRSTQGYGIHLWDLTDPAHPAQLGTTDEEHIRPIRALAFSPDGRHLASGGEDHSVRVWDLADPRHPVSSGPPLLDNQDDVGELAFSPAGQFLASGGADRSVRAWDVTNPRQPSPLPGPLAGHTAAVGAIAFSPAHQLLASASADNSVRVWQLDVEQVIAGFCHGALAQVNDQRIEPLLQKVSSDPVCGG